MSKTLATYSFLPWLRKGIANQIQADDHDPAVKLRAAIDISFKISGEKAEGGTIDETIQKPVSLYGPGDIIGIDAKAVIKTEPRNWITNVEPNYMACIEFYDEDFPWRYTPAKAQNGRLRPWLTLVVLEEGAEFKEGQNIAGRPLPYFELLADPGEVFPKAEQLWAWAHVHVNRDLILNDVQTDPEEGEPFIEQVSSEATDAILDQYEAVLSENRDLAYSRIVCPRKLAPNKAYHAFLIPTFESGRLAGLGIDPETVFETAPIHATSSSWDSYPDREEATLYPIYHRWYFRTGNIGDFEYLVRLLQPRPMNSKVGRRDMDVTDPGANLSGITDEPEDGEEVPQLNGVLKLGGALRIPIQTITDPDEKEEVERYENWAQPYPRKFQKELAAFINLADDYSEKTAKEAQQNPELPEAIVQEAASDEEPDPLITAPLYGKWHALTRRLLDPDDEIPDTNWVHELNLDPRFRVAGGFGTYVVQKNQENYMEAAWEQVGDVLKANQFIRYVFVARAASKYWYNAYLQPLKQRNEGAFLWLTQPIQARILTQGINLEETAERMTVFHQVKIGKVPGAAFSPTMRKISRPRGRLSSALPFHNAARPVADLAARINEDEVQPAPPKIPPSGVPSPEELAEELKPKGLPEFLENWLRDHPWVKWVPLALAILIVLLLIIFVGPALGSITIGMGSLAGIALLGAASLVYLFLWMNRWQNQIQEAETLHPGNLTPARVDELPASPDFELTIAGQGVRFSRGNTDSEEAVRFKNALKDKADLMIASRNAAEQPEPPRLDLGLMADDIFATIDPESAIPKYTRDHVRIPGRIKDNLVESFTEAMAYPEIDIPMYKPLIDISADLFLPNINFIEQNSISLLETNQKFIESYMVGLNHEFARELLWREYPTDQRGSYFRQFWDVSSFFDPDAADAEAQKEKLRDIPPIHRWSKFDDLGDHDHREKPGDKEQEVVLVIRGELLKKYPNAVVFAHKARWQPTDDTKDDPNPQPDRAKERALAPVPAGQEENPPTDIVKTPLYQAKADPDIYFFGFDLTAVEARGMLEGEPETLDDDPGWFFVIQERPGQPRFGLDSGTNTTSDIKVWNDLAWGTGSLAVADGKFLEITDATELIDVSANPLASDEDEKKIQRKEDVQITWNKNMNAAEIAYILFQAPVMVAVHGAEMLPEPVNP